MIALKKKCYNEIYIVFVKLQQGYCEETSLKLKQVALVTASQHLIGLMNMSLILFVPSCVSRFHASPHVL